MKSPAALALRGREYPLELSGTAWIVPQTGTIARIEAGIDDTLQDVGLKSLRAEIEFAPLPLADPKLVYWFPARASVEVQTPRQHWRNLHQFTDYKKFSVATEEKVNEPMSSHCHSARPHPYRQTGERSDLEKRHRVRLYSLYALAIAINLAIFFYGFDYYKLSAIDRPFSPKHHLLQTKRPGRHLSRIFRRRPVPRDFSLSVAQALGVAWRPKAAPGTGSTFTS